jgi:hypothetical protein
MKSTNRAWPIRPLTIIYAVALALTFSKPVFAEETLKGTLVLYIDVPNLELMKVEFNGKNAEACSLCPPGTPSDKCPSTTTCTVERIPRAFTTGAALYTEGSPGCLTIIWGGTAKTYPQGCR